MSMLNYIVEKLKSGAITFVNAVTLANRDYPYHDFLRVTTYDEISKYTVGANQLHGHGDQRKYFVSKSTLIFTTVEIEIRFNNANNVAILILPNTWYEFKSNIYQVFFDLSNLSEEDYLLFYFEGVLPNEQRGAE